MNVLCIVLTYLMKIKILKLICVVHQLLHSVLCKCWSHREAAAQSAACHVSIKVGIQSVVKFRQQQHIG